MENEDFPLRRFIKHPSGSKLSGSWSKGRNKKYPYYRFHRPEMTIKKEVLELKFQKLLNSFKLDSQFSHRLKRSITSEFKSKGISNIQVKEALFKTYDALKQKQNDLINKNLEGVISDSILRDQLNIIEISLQETNDRLNILQLDSGCSLEILFDYLKKYFQSPYEAWRNADFEEKLMLQWFYFPQGVLFNGTDCRTVEICNAFKLKAAVFDSDSSMVPHRFKTPNHNLNIPSELIMELRSDITKLDRLIKEKNIDHPK